MFRRRTLCQLAGLDPEQFKSLRRRSLTPLDVPADRDPEGVYARDKARLDADDERGGHPRYTLCDAAILDAQQKLVATGGFSYERAATILRNVRADSARIFGDHDEWWREAARGPLFLVQRTELEAGEMMDTGRHLGTLAAVSGWLRQSDQLALATIVDLSVSVAAVIERAKRFGIPLPEEQTHDR